MSKKMDHFYKYLTCCLVFHIVLRFIPMNDDAALRPLISSAFDLILLQYFMKKYDSELKEDNRKLFKIVRVVEICLFIFFLCSFAYYEYLVSTLARLGKL